MKLLNVFAIAISLLLLPACGKDNTAERDKQLKAQQQAQQEANRKAAIARRDAQLKKLEVRKNIVSLVKARHGQVNLRGIMVKNQSALKDEFKGVFATHFQHGKDHNGNVVKGIKNNKRVTLSSQVSAVVAASTMSSVPGTTLIVGYNNCVADVKIDKSCVDVESDEDLEGYSSEELRMISFACDMKRKLGIDINPRAMRIAPVRKNHYEKTKSGAVLNGDGITARRVQNVIMCGAYSAAEYKFMTGLAENVVLKNFVYDLNGNYGYSQIDIGAKTLYLMGNNRIDAKGREGGQAHPPKIHVEVVARIKSHEGGKLQLVSVGSSVDLSAAAKAKAEAKAEEAAKKDDKK